jgi:hypothetical protein
MMWFQMLIMDFLGWWVCRVWSRLDGTPQDG